MKKALSLILTACLMLSLAAPFADAAAANEATAQQTVSALGIMVGDQNGNMDLSGSFTRAQFAKMMIAASTYKDTISSTAVSSPFKDVNYKYWAAPYIQTAVTAGWITGYTDGTYRPESAMRLEEAVTAVLKMLGYTTSDFAGAFPDAQLAKYTALGLNTGISKTKGQTMTRRDAMYLFYNLMTTKTKADKYYAETLGYTVNASGELDYGSLVKANMKGPFIVESSSWASGLPFSAANATVYKNGVVSKLSSVTNYDVYYYNASMRTIWVYRNQVTGVYTAATPSAAAPTSVTVAGKEYTLSTSAASYALSTTGSYKIGDTITLLLGMNGDVVGVAASGTVETTRYGIVTATGTKTYTDAYGNSYTSDYVSLACLDGAAYEFYKNSTYLNVGDLVRVSYDGGDPSYSIMTDSSLSGTVNSTATAVDAVSFADDIQIMDTTSKGSYTILYPSRLAGAYLSSSNVRWYLKDENGKISKLVLNNATGDCYKYGVLTYASEKSGDMSISSSYQYIVDGATGSYSSSNTLFGASWGPALFEFSGKDIVTLRNLTSLSLTSLTSQYGYNSGAKYALGDNVAVFLYQNGSYSPGSLTTLINSGGYTLTGYYDGTLSGSTRLRVIVAS